MRLTEKDKTEIISELDRLDTSGYLEFEAKTYQFNVALSQSEEKILDVEPVTFLSGNCYSIIFSGSTTGVTAVDFNAKVYLETSL